MNNTTTKPLRFETKRAAYDYCLDNDINPLLVQWLAGMQGQFYGVGLNAGFYIVNKLIGTFSECAAAGVRHG